MRGRRIYTSVLDALVPVVAVCTLAMLAATSPAAVNPSEPVDVNIIDSRTLDGEQVPSTSKVPAHNTELHPSALSGESADLYGSGGDAGQVQHRR